MTFKCTYKVTLNNGKVCLVDNFEHGLGSLVEFDYDGNHYCVRMECKGKFKTFIGTLNKEDFCYNYKQCNDFEVVKITGEEEYIADGE